MLFGLITTTREWYESDTAIRRFNLFSIGTLVASLLGLIFYVKPSLYDKWNASSLSHAIFTLIGMALAFAMVELIFGMGWYFFRVDPSPFGLKAIWLILALVLSPYVEIFYHYFVYRPQVFRSRKKSSETGSL